MTKGVTDMDNYKSDKASRQKQRSQRSASACSSGGSTVERIKVYAKIVNGRTVCICHAGKKGCGENCQRDVVTRDKYFGWEKTFRRNRYGK